MMLSPHFSLDELTRSDLASRHGLANAPSQGQISNLQRLANEVLEPIRERCGRPLIVTSGYRSSMVNALVHGSNKSDHMSGCAADIHAPGISLDDLGNTVRALSAGLPLKQCILEFAPNGWVHVSVPAVGETARREFLRADIVAGQTTYSAWGM